ncbi:hypothetical protein EVAR_78500_1 [Eumeta japonica]|uniref:Uncharacterized protein n=1 Tax=Eumeta variegata TaxID=151549 RepID=A0A4C1TY96_EUMVA|nr:hypothetical protein EVAR_78500_1 [Eumeta japonica]
MEEATRRPRTIITFGISARASADAVWSRGVSVQPWTPASRAGHGTTSVEPGRQSRGLPARGRACRDLPPALWRTAYTINYASLRQVHKR